MKEWNTVIITCLCCNNSYVRLLYSCTVIITCLWTRVVKYRVDRYKITVIITCLLGCALVDLYRLVINGILL